MRREYQEATRLILGMTDEELDGIAKVFNLRRDALRTAKMSTFLPGQTVSFKSRSGTTIIGTVEKFNRKSVNVDVHGRTWRVPPSLLTPVTEID